jgi:putative transposase
MKSKRSSRYSGYRFPCEVISYAVWAYHRFCLSFRDVEDLLAERGILVSYETIRLWCQKFGTDYVRKLKRRGQLGDHWHLDEVFLRINGQRQCLWRAIDQDGNVIDILVQARRDRCAAERFFRRLLRRQERAPRCLITDKLRSYSASVRTSFCHVANTDRALRQQSSGGFASADTPAERQMRRFKSVHQRSGFFRSPAWFTICSNSDAT